MITRLKRRFIALAMVSLIALLSVIVAGMNIINYNTVINEADNKLSALTASRGRLPFSDDDFFGDDYDDIDAETREFMEEFGRRGPFYGRDEISRDEIEETRFFSVLTTTDGVVLRTNTDRIYAVDEAAAGQYAVTALASGKFQGFIDEYRYAVADEGLFTRVTFLDCSSALASFRRFLYASIAMSVVGLLAIFGIICYFAGRIVKPVAESYEKQKRFITDAGHEIKTPLAIIKANIDVMRMDLEDLEAAQGVSGSDDADLSEATTADAPAPDEEASLSGVASSLGSINESLTDIDGQVDRLTSLTNDLVYLSRMEEAGGNLTMTQIPVSDIVAETTDSFSALALERKKTLDTDITPMLTMQGSSKEIEKLVSILVENALKYSPEEDTVRVGLKKDGKNIVLEVSNRTLSPLSDEDLAHVFDRFYRTDKSRNSEAGGHGIGLSMASAIVAAHGGKIGARSGDGTQFVVTATMPAAA